MIKSCKTAVKSGTDMVNPHKEPRLDSFGEEGGTCWSPPPVFVEESQGYQSSDWLSSYPKHDLKNKIKFAVHHLCQHILIKENAAL